nr:immunoglobulin heavy chain junction region [Mus musculus]MBK4188871.1 immunoglobulin heavy chain junction region [Mus musculus]MBK4188872.1 immunoglobulin heavy chain junction region [Mus musculus]MBK4188873.1 immunoglobulin heavy chain junction region [Mus musculus]MBK4188874.1 immunoglobulin heavy chain junction region [Mus musculus]
CARFGQLRLRENYFDYW